MKERAQLLDTPVASWGLYWLDSVKIWEDSVHWLGRCGRFPTGLFAEKRCFFARFPLFDHEGACTAH